MILMIKIFRLQQQNFIRSFWHFWTINNPKKETMFLKLKISKLTISELMLIKNLVAEL